MSGERRGVHGRLEDEGTEDEFSKRGKVNIRYTIASLLEFNKGEACRKLPGDFNVMLLREFDVAMEYGKIPSNTSGSFPSKWDLEFPSERHANHLLMLSKDSSLRGNCSLERDNIPCQQLPSEAESSAGILGPKIQRSDIFQLKRSENPYIPPHCIKKEAQPDTSSECQVACSGNSSFSGAETDHESLAETDSVNSAHDDSWRRDKGTGIIDDTLKSRTTGNDDDDDHHLFDVFWDEILEIVQLQQDPELSPDVAQDDAPDSEVERSLPSKNRFASAKGSENFIMLDNDHLADPEWEFNLPDEDSLITIDDLTLVSPSPIPTLDRNSTEADKMMRNAAVNFIQNSEYVYITKPDDRYSTGSTTGLVSRGQLLPWLSHSQCPEKSSLHTGSDRMCFLSDFMTPNAIPCLPILDWYSCSDFHQGPDGGTILTSRGTNNSLFHYSLWQQPNIGPDELSHLLFDTRHIVAPDLSATQFLHLTPQQATFNGFGMSGKGGFGDKGISSFRRNQQ